MLMEGHVLQVAGAAPQPHTRPWPGCATQKWGAQILGSWVRGLGGRGDILASGGRDPARSRAVAPSAGGRTSRARDAWPAGPVPRVCTCARTRARLPSCARTRTRAHARLRACERPVTRPDTLPTHGHGQGRGIVFTEPLAMPTDAQPHRAPCRRLPRRVPRGPWCWGLGPSPDVAAPHRALPHPCSVSKSRTAPADRASCLTAARPWASPRTRHPSCCKLTSPAACNQIPLHPSTQPCPSWLPRPVSSSLALVGPQDGSHPPTFQPSSPPSFAT